MKIIIVLERVEPWRGGAETSIQQFAHALVNRGVEAHLLTATRGHMAGPVRYECVPALGPTRTARTLAFVRNARAFLKEHPFDVVHAVTPTPGASIYQPRGGTVKETQECNVQIRSNPFSRSLKRTTNLLSVKHWLLSRLESQIVRSPDCRAIVAVSQYVARQIRDQYPAAEDRVQVVFNGVDLNGIEAGDTGEVRERLRMTYRIPKDAVVMLAVGHNFRLKGIEQLIRAVGSLSHSPQLPELRVLVVGRDNPVRHQALAERLGVSNRVIFTGPTERVGWFYQTADVLVHPTFYDPCSRVVLEALAAGLPCITTRCNGAAEVIEDGVHGFVIESPHQLDELSDRMARLCDTRLRERCGEAARSLRPRVDMNRHVDEMMGIYERIGEKEA
jgi:UDP-glucose:(heptosyl)LPS alpha-1,3-glucosyltransferase